MSQIGAVSAHQHGVSYWLRDCEDVLDVEVSGPSSTTRSTRDSGEIEYRIDIDALDCEQRPGLGFRPKQPVKVSLKVEGKSKKETLVLS